MPMNPWTLTTKPRRREEPQRVLRDPKGFGSWQLPAGSAIAKKPHLLIIPTPSGFFSFPPNMQTSLTTRSVFLVGGCLETLNCQLHNLPSSTFYKRTSNLGTNYKTKILLSGSKRSKANVGLRVRSWNTTGPPKVGPAATSGSQGREHSELMKRWVYWIQNKNAT